MERIYAITVVGLILTALACIGVSGLCVLEGRPQPESLSTALGASLGSLGTFLLHTLQFKAVSGEKPNGPPAAPAAMPKP